MNYIVRTAQIKDLDTLVSFTLEEAKEAEGRAKSPEVIRNGIQRALENSSVAKYWVLENHERKIVGNVSIVREWSDWHASYYWWIQSMFIRPEYRGRKLMKLLLDKVREAARKEDALEIRLYVHKDNIRAIKAYQREGFATGPYQIMTMELTHK